MTLRRTASGLASVHLFHGVDVIVYCEGGESLPLQKVVEGGGDDATLDVYFWREVRKCSSSQRKFHFKSIGSKSVLLSIAEDVDKNGYQSVRVAMDSDHDGHLGRKLEFTCVLYTYGYSWENDVLHPAIIERLFWRFQNECEASRKCFDSLNEAIDKFEKDICLYCEYDIALVAKGKALWPRDKPLSVIAFGNLPSLSIGKVTELLANMGYKRGPRRPVKLGGAGLRFAYGHLVASYVYQLFKHCIKRVHPRFSVDRDTFLRVAIGEFGEAVRAGELGGVGEYFLGLAESKFA